MAAALLSSFAFIVCLMAGIYFFGYAARRASALFVTALEIVFGSIILIPIVLLSEELSVAELITKPAKQQWLWLGAASYLGFVGGNFFSLINLKTTGERVNSLLSPAITAASVFAGDNKLFTSSHTEQRS